MDMRNMRGMDGRRLPPRNARGEFRRRRSGRRGDRGMDYADMNYTVGRGGRPMRDYTYGQDMPTHDYRGYDMNDMPHYDGNHPKSHGSTYYPIQAMGTFEGYYGMPEQDYARGGRRDYGYDMRYDMRGYHNNMDYGYDYGGDYGEKLTKEDLEHWDKRLMKKVHDRDKHFFTKENIINRAKSMGVQMNEFNEEELFTTVLMMYTDHCDSVGQNYDMYVKLAQDFLEDDDTSVSGGEKLAVYYDCIVEDYD